MRLESSSAVATASVVAALAVGLATIGRAATAVQSFGMQTVATYLWPQLGGGTLLVVAFSVLAMALRSPLRTSMLHEGDEDPDPFPAKVARLVLIPAVLVGVLVIPFGAILKDSFIQPPTGPREVAIAVLVLFGVFLAWRLVERPSGRGIVLAVTAWTLLFGQSVIVLAYLYLPVPSRCCPW